MKRNFPWSLIPLLGLVGMVDGADRGGGIVPRPNDPFPRAEVKRLTGDCQGAKLSRDIRILWLSGPEAHKGGEHEKATGDGGIQVIALPGPSQLYLAGLDQLDPHLGKGQFMLIRLCPGVPGLLFAKIGIGQDPFTVSGHDIGSAPPTILLFGKAGLIPDPRIGGLATA